MSSSTLVKEKDSPGVATLRNVTSGIPLSLLSGDNVRGRRLFDALGTSPLLDMHPFEERQDEPLSEVLVYDAASRGHGSAPDLTDAAEVFERCRHLLLEQVVVVSSARVYEPGHHHPGRVSEEYFPILGRGRRAINSIAAQWRELEDLARWRLGNDSSNATSETAMSKAATSEAVTKARPGPRLTVLRAANVPLVGSRDELSRRLDGSSWATVVAGRDPVVQLLSMEDLAAAIVAVVEARRSGLFHVAPRGALHLRRALRLAGVRYLPLPGWLLRESKDERAYLSAPWTLSADTLHRELKVPEPRSQVEVVATLKSQSSQRSDRGMGPATEALEVSKAPGVSKDPEVSKDLTFLEDSTSLEDPFGFDEAYVSAFEHKLFRFLHRRYWRVDVEGVEHVPQQGGAVLVGNHRGFMPWDGVMTLHTLRQSIGRTPRYLIHPTLVKFPFLANYMTKLGGVIACRENGDWVLQQGQLLGVYPEGIRGAFAQYGKDVYQLRSFGRLDFVKMALRHQVPMVPFVCVGSAEIYPILYKFNWRWFKRWAEWPCLPLTPTMGSLPLPSKWYLRFLPPLTEVLEHGPEAADDPAIVKALGVEVRRRMQHALDDLLRRRRSRFFGSLMTDSEEDI